MARPFGTDNYKTRILKALMTEKVLTEHELAKITGLDHQPNGYETLNMIYKYMVANGLPIYRKYLFTKWTRTGSATHRNMRIVIYYLK